MRSGPNGRSSTPTEGPRTAPSPRPRSQSCVRPSLGHFSRERTGLTLPRHLSAGIAKAQLSLKPTEETLQTAFHTMLQMVRCSARHALHRRTDILLVFSPLVALGKRYRYVLHRNLESRCGSGLTSPPSSDRPVPPRRLDLEGGHRQAPGARRRREEVHPPQRRGKGLGVAHQPDQGSRRGRLRTR